MKLEKVITTESGVYNSTFSTLFCCLFLHFTSRRLCANKKDAAAEI